MTATMTEAQFIESESKKCADRLRRQLAHVQHTGMPSSKNSCETLLINDLIAFGGPDESNPFNHYRLTARALHFLETGLMD